MAFILINLALYSFAVFFSLLNKDFYCDRIEKEYKNKCKVISILSFVPIVNFFLVIFLTLKIRTIYIMTKDDFLKLANNEREGDKDEKQ